MGIGRLVPEDPVLMRKTVTHALDYFPQLSRMAKSFDIFPSGDLIDALAGQKLRGTHQGVMLSFADDDVVQVAPSVANNMRLHDRATYVLSGGLGGLGRSLVRLLAGNGARYLALLSRAGPESPAAKTLAKDMAGFGVTVKTFACDIGDDGSVAIALAECERTMPPIRGVIQAAAVVRDAVFDNFTFDDWQANLRPKVQGSWNLHRQLPKDMDFFVMLSSIAGLMGHPSQAGYAAGNTYQDALAHHRRSVGLPAVSLDLGAMLDVGAIKDGTVAASFSASDISWMNEAELHAVMTMCISGQINDRAIPPQICTGLPSGGMLTGQPGTPIHFERPMFSFLKCLGTSASTAGDTTTSLDVAAELVDQLSDAKSLIDAESCIGETLRARLAKNLGRSVDGVDLEQPLHRYGVDSLGAVELRTWIGKKLRADVSLFDVLNAQSVHELATKIAGVSRLVTAT